jgi:hypothetical protein
VTAKTRRELVPACRALDRVLMHKATTWCRSGRRRTAWPTAWRFGIPADAAVLRRRRLGLCDFDLVAQRKAPMKGQP